MFVSYHPDYVIPLPEGHAFPMRKYELLHACLLREGLLSPAEVHAPEEAPWDAVALVHGSGYLDRLQSGTLTEAEVRRIGMPWSTALVRRARLAVQGTINAAVAAIESVDRIGANLAGGTHHALPDGGEGYCTLNDVAIAIRWLQREGYIRRALVCDLDVHHGNGTAVVFAGDDAVCTFSMHGERNFPLRKPPSTLDVPLADGTGDGAYLDLLRQHLPRLMDIHVPDIVFYLAGVDVVAGGSVRPSAAHRGRPRQPRPFRDRNGRGPIHAPLSRARRWVRAHRAAHGRTACARPSRGAPLAAVQLPALA